MIKVTKLPESRWEDYRRLRLRALKTDSAAYGSSYTEEAGLPPDVWRSRIGNCLFAMSEGEPVGMIGVLLGDRAKTKHIAHIVGVYVAPEHRGRGVGRALLEAALSKMRSKNRIIKVELSVNPDFLPALTLYKKAGFKETGTAFKELRVRGRFYDLLNMELMIR
jgi:RimJ/RimL family protein N-acetyltransferase